MLTLNRKQWRTVGAIHLGAVVLGVTAAFAANGATRADQVYAATHCTRYAPVISQDFNCLVKGTMSSGGFYSTPSTALRDNNQIALSASRSWQLAYAGGNNAFASGTGTAGSLGSSGGFATARCLISGSSVNGRCTTNWHD